MCDKIAKNSNENNNNNRNANEKGFKSKSALKNEKKRIFIVEGRHGIAWHFDFRIFYVLDV